MPNSPESQNNSKFKPIKVMDMHNDCKKVNADMPNYKEFLKLIRTMEGVGYTIISHNQIEELKTMIGEISTKPATYRSGNRVLKT